MLFTRTGDNQVWFYIIELETTFLMIFSAISYFMANPPVYFIKSTWTDQVTVGTGLTEPEMMVIMHMIAVPLVLVGAYYLIFKNNGKRSTTRWTGRCNSTRSCNFHSWWFLGGETWGGKKWNLKIHLLQYNMSRIGILFVGSRLSTNCGNLERMILSIMTKLT